MVTRSRAKRCGDARGSKTELTMRVLVGDPGQRYAQAIILALRKLGAGCGAQGRPGVSVPQPQDRYFHVAKEAYRKQVPPARLLLSQRERQGKVLFGPDSGHLRQGRNRYPRQSVPCLAWKGGTMPSRCSAESGNNTGTSLEAMACRTAAVSTRVGGVLDHGTDGETMLLAEPRDLDEMTRQVSGSPGTKASAGLSHAKQKRPRRNSRGIGVWKHSRKSCGPPERPWRAPCAYERISGEAPQSPARPTWCRIASRLPLKVENSSSGTISRNLSRSRSELRVTALG